MALSWNDINNDIKFFLDIPVTKDINNDIRTKVLSVNDLKQDIRFVHYTIAYSDLKQNIKFFNRSINDVKADIRTRKMAIVDLKQDTRFHVRVFKDALNDVRFEKTYYKNFYGRTSIVKDSVKDLYGVATVSQPLPVIPTGLITTDMKKGDLIKLNWASDSNYGYNVYTTAPGLRTKRNNTAVIGTEFLAGNLTENTAYTFVIVGVNGEGIESADSVSAIGTPTFPAFTGGASRFVNYTYSVKINGSTRSDIILNNIELGYGSTPATARFTIPKDPETAGLPVINDGVECIVNGRTLFKGIIKNIEKSLSSSGMAVSFISFSKLIDYNSSCVDQAYIEQNLAEYGIDVTDQTWLQAYETIANQQGNFRLYYNMLTDIIEWYQLGTGTWNRSVTIGKNVMEWNVTEDTLNRVTKIIVIGGRRRIQTKWLPLIFVSTKTYTGVLNQEISYSQEARVEAYNIGNIEIQGHASVGEIQYEFDPNISIVPSDVYNYTYGGGTGGGKRTEWHDGTKEPRQVLKKYTEAPSDWVSVGTNIAYQYLGVGNTQIPVMARITLTSAAKKTVPVIGSGTAIREGRIPSENINYGFIRWAETPWTARGGCRIRYTYEEDAPIVVVGSGSISRTITDTQYIIDDNSTEEYVLAEMLKRANAELDKADVSNKNGRIKILGDENFDLKTRVNVYGEMLDVIRVTHDFSNGYTTDIELTNEKFRFNIPPYQEQRKQVEYERKTTGTQSYLQYIARKISQVPSTNPSQQDPVKSIPKSPYALYGD